MTQEEIKVDYHIRFRHIPISMMFHRICDISIDHIRVKAGVDANDWDLKVAVCRELDNLNYKPDDIRIESFQRL